MKFKWRAKDCMLQGEQVPGYSLIAISSKKLGKIAQVACLQCFNIQVEYHGVELQERKRCHQ